MWQVLGSVAAISYILYLSLRDFEMFCGNLSGKHFQCRVTMSCFAVSVHVLDEDECINGVAKCHENAECINSPGVFRCQCKPGFDGDGVITCLGTSSIL